MTMLVVMPRGAPNRPAWWTEEAVEQSAKSFGTNLAFAFDGQAHPHGSHVRFGGIEVLVDPGGAKGIGFGLEIQIEGRGTDMQETVESWTWAIGAVIHYMRAAAGNSS